MEHKKTGYNKNSGRRTDKQGRRAYREDSRPYRAASEETPDENIVYGRNAVKELLESGRDIEKLYVCDGEHEGSINLILGMVADRGIPVFQRDRAKLDSLSRGGKHQGVVAIAAERNYVTVEDILKSAEERGEPPFIVICDGVEDPHNLGAIIRNAECSGVHGIIIPKRRAVGLTTTVSKASAGALEHMLIAKVTNIAVTVDELKEQGLWIYAADMDGSEYYNTDMKGAVALVLGSEGFGISRLVKEKCDFTVSIPLYGRVNSMNVSCAAAVLLSEAAKQRNNK